MRSDRLCPVLKMELSRFYHSSLRARVQTDRSESRCANSSFPKRTSEHTPQIASGLPINRPQSAAGFNRSFRPPRSRLLDNFRV